MIVFSAEEMDKHDEALRETIRKLWPIQGKKMVSLLVPPNEGQDVHHFSLLGILAGILIHNMSAA